MIWQGTISTLFVASCGIADCGSPYLPVGLFWADTRRGLTATRTSSNTCTAQLLLGSEISSSCSVKKITFSELGTRPRQRGHVFRTTFVCFIYYVVVVAKLNNCRLPNRQTGPNRHLFCQTGPKGHLFCQTGPKRHLFCQTGPKGHLFRQTGPKERLFYQTGPKGNLFCQTNKSTLDAHRLILLYEAYIC